MIDGPGIDALHSAWLSGLWPCHVERSAAESNHLSLDKGGLYVGAEIPRQARDDKRLGSVVALSDVNSVLAERYAYDVFGRPTLRDAKGTAIDESGLGNPYRFTGRRYDGEAGLYYYRARYYDYYTARFLQPDPIGYDDGLNMYGYVSNNPLLWSDPLGLYHTLRYDMKSQTIDIEVPIKLVGHGGVTKEQVRKTEETFNLGVQYFWNREKVGEATINLKIVPPTAGMPTNEVNVLPTGKVSEVIEHRCGMWSVGYNGDTFRAAHETGHFLDLGDRYREVGDSITADPFFYADDIMAGGLDITAFTVFELLGREYLRVLKDVPWERLMWTFPVPGFSGKVCK